MPGPNFASGTVWTGDNLPVLRGMNDACIDLIYLDPPFNSNRHYEAPIGSKAAGAAFKDAWTLDDIDVHEHGELADRNPAAYAVIEAARQASGKGMQSYLIFMAVRLLEMRRILTDTGSIYLHCDPTASHYLKLLMDPIFTGGGVDSETKSFGHTPAPVPLKCANSIASTMSYSGTAPVKNGHSTATLSGCLTKNSTPTERARLSLIH